MHTETPVALVVAQDYGLSIIVVFPTTVFLRDIFIFIFPFRLRYRNVEYQIASRKSESRIVSVNVKIPDKIGR